MEKPSALPEGFVDAFAEMASKIEGAFLHCDDGDPAAIRQAYKWALLAGVEFCDRMMTDPDTTGRLSRIADRLSNLMYMLGDLERGVVHPVLDPAKVNHRKVDSSFIWNARSHVAAGVRCLECSGLTVDEAVEVVVQEYPDCGRLLRPPASFAPSVRRWHKKFMAGKVTHRPAQAGFDTIAEMLNFHTPVTVEAARAEYEERGRNYLATASEESAQVDPDPDWWRDEFPDANES
jgi:hypothetical protein